jgi:hypothetical protein
MKALEIYLRSGSVFTVDATDVSTTRSQIDGELTEIEWVTPNGHKRKLHSIVELNSKPRSALSRRRCDG